MLVFGVTISKQMHIWVLFFIKLIILGQSKNKKLLGFKVFDDRHTSKNISQIMLIVLEEYNLSVKLFSISLDMLMQLQIMLVLDILKIYVSY